MIFINPVDELSVRWIVVRWIVVRWIVVRWIVVRWSVVTMNCRSTNCRSINCPSMYCRSILQQFSSRVAGERRLTSVKKVAACTACTPARGILVISDFRPLSRTADPYQSVIFSYVCHNFQTSFFALSKTNAVGNFEEAMELCHEASRMPFFHERDYEIESGRLCASAYNFGLEASRVGELSRAIQWLQFSLHLSGKSRRADAREKVCWYDYGNFVLCYAEQNFSVWAVSVTGLFGFEAFRSDYEILHVNFLMQTYLNQRKVLFRKAINMIKDPTSNQHQHMIFMLTF